MGDIVDVIGWVSVLGAAVLFLAGMADLATSWGKTSDTKAAVKKGAVKAEFVAQQAVDGVGTQGGVQEYAGLDVSSNWEALAKLATALKDLDRSTRLFTLALAFMAVAGTTVGLDAIGTGLGKPN